MAQYQNLAKLRSALTSDDAETRSEAYGTVYEQADVSPQTVLSDDEVVDHLRDVGVLEAEEQRPSSAEQRDRIIELLQNIEANTGGDSA